MHLGGDQLEAALDDPVHLFRIEALGERGEPREVGEEHGHLPSLALERGAGLENLLGEMPRCVRYQPRSEIGHCGRNACGHRAGRRCRRRFGWGHAVPALETELRPGGQLGPALRA
jgi:hypothetical protein